MTDPTSETRSSSPPINAQSDLVVGICTFNNEDTIERTLKSINSLTDSIFVVDSGSTDGTVSCCQSYSAQVVTRPWPGYAAQKQFILDECREVNWILLLDSDESLTPELQKSIRKVVTENDPRYVGWELNRKVWFLGQYLQHTFQPEWRLRLVRGGSAHISSIGGKSQGTAQVHETVAVQGKVGKLVGDLRHDSWRDLADMCRRNIHYAQLNADAGASGGSLAHVLVSPPAAFFKQLILKQGWRDGWRGIIAAGGFSSATLLKHLFIAQRRHLNIKTDHTEEMPDSGK